MQARPDIRLPKAKVDELRQMLLQPKQPYFFPFQADAKQARKPRAPVHMKKIVPLINRPKVALQQKNAFKKPVVKPNINRVFQRMNAFKKSINKPAVPQKNGISKFQRLKRFMNFRKKVKTEIVPEPVIDIKKNKIPNHVIRANTKANVLNKKIVSVTTPMGTAQARPVRTPFLQMQGKSILQVFLEQFRVTQVMKNSKPVFLGAGTYNEVHLVQDNQGKQYALRITRNIMQGEEAKTAMAHELGLSLEMSKKKIGPQVYGAEIFVVHVRYQNKKTVPFFIAGMLLDIMDSDLHFVLEKRPNTINYDLLIQSIVRKVHLLAKEGYFCADIKPANILVKGNEVFMADFDTSFCGRDSFLEKACQSVQVSKNQCVVSPSAWKDIRDIYSRGMMYMLVEFIAFYFKNRVIQTYFIPTLVNDYMSRFMMNDDKKKRFIFIGNQQVPLITIVRYAIPGATIWNQSSGTYRRTNVLNIIRHYHQGKDIFRGRHFQFFFKPFLQDSWGKARNALLKQKVVQDLQVRRR